MGLPIPFIPEWLIEIFVPIEHEVSEVLPAQPYNFLSRVITKNSSAKRRNQVLANILVAEKDFRGDLQTLAT